MNEIIDLAGATRPANIPTSIDPDQLDPYKPSWYDDGLCNQTDPEAFFPEKGESTKAAKLVCAACPAQQLCLEWALARQERFGVWGGKSERERRQILRDRAATSETSAPTPDPRFNGPRISPAEHRDALIRAAERSGISNAALAEQLRCSTDAACTARMRFRTKMAEKQLRAAG